MSKYDPWVGKITKAEIGSAVHEGLLGTPASHPSLGHSQDLWQRIEAEMRRGDSQRKRRMEEADQRITERMYKPDRGAGLGLDKDPQR